MEEHVRVGLVGLGRMGRFHAANLAGRTPLAELVRIVDASEKLARDTAERLGGVEWSTSYADLLDDPEVEAVVVASPTPLHAEMTEAAAEAEAQRGHGRRIGPLEVLEHENARASGGEALASGEGSWRTGASLPEGRSEVAVAELDGKVYVLGGFTRETTSSTLKEPGRWRRCARPGVRSGRRW